MIAACGAPPAPDLALDLSNPGRPAIVVTGLSRGDLSALERANLSSDAWTTLFPVIVERPSGSPAPMAVAGRYDIEGSRVRFTPMLPFEPGRAYRAAFEPATLPDDRLRHLPKISRVIAVPLNAPTAPTRVANVYPSGPDVPANLLRMYVQFVGQMGIRTGERYISALDDSGREITGALLPLDTDLWNPEHTRFTILFDPGRVKRGIFPNRAMGRPLKAGDGFAIVISREWPDAYGRPLASEFRKEYRVGPAIERPLTTDDWRMQAPAAGTLAPLVVSFGSPLDHALLQRALTVVRGEAPVSGAIRIANGETQWSLAPRDPWQAGAYTLVVAPELEDPAGNRVGHAFETRGGADDTRQAPARVPFEIR